MTVTNVTFVTSGWNDWYKSRFCLRLESGLDWLSEVSTDVRIDWADSVIIKLNQRKKYKLALLLSGKEHDRNTQVRADKMFIRLVKKNKKCQLPEDFATRCVHPMDRANSPPLPPPSSFFAGQTHLATGVTQGERATCKFKTVCL